jgi:hypothetical protein
MKPVLALISLLGCSVLGCSGADLEAEGAGSRRRWASADESVAELMSALQHRLEDEGFSVGAIALDGFLTANGERTHRLDIPAEACLTIVALTSRGIRDLDAGLFDPSGEALAEDVEPDAHPTIQVCAGDAPRRVYYHLHAYDGAGSFLVGSFLGPRDRFEAAARVIGGRPGVARSEGGTDDRDPRIRELLAGARRRGFELEGEPLRVPLAAGQRVRVPVSGEGGRCYTVAAFGINPGLSLDLRMLDELDAEIGRDVTESESATLQFCADGEVRGAAEVFAAEGAGAAEVVILTARSAEVGGSSGLWLGERPPYASRHSIDELDAALGRQELSGWSARRAIAEGDLVRGEAIRFALRAEARTCTRFAVAGGPGVASLGVRVADRASRLLWAQSSEDEAYAVATMCPDDATDYEVEVVSRGGQGAFRAFAVVRPAREVFAIEPPSLRGALLDEIDRGRRIGFTAELGDAVVRERGSESLELGGRERCERIVVRSASSAGATLRTARGVAARRAGSRMEFTSCEPGTLDLTFGDKTLVLRLAAARPESD